MTPEGGTATVHIRAALLALVTAVIGLVAVSARESHLERHYIHALAPQVLRVKDQGEVLQRDTFSQPDILPLYGSSELVKPIPDKASVFFRKYPTAFAVSPVGKAGTTSINMLEKLSAVGADAKGKKVAISLSPSWFFVDSPISHYYAGNFSLVQANALAFSDDLSFALKRDIAERMLDYPSTLAPSPVVRFALERLQGGTTLDRLLYSVAWPLGKLEGAILQAQDQHEVALAIMRRHNLKAQPHRHPAELNWDDRVGKVTRHMQAAGTAAGSKDVVFPFPGGDEAFRRTLLQAREWTDLELLIREMKELGVEPLLLSIPVDGTYLDKRGVSRASRELYVEKLRALAARYNVALLDFDEYEEDPSFLNDHHDHLSVKGWMYFNRALDAFFHGNRDDLQHVGPRPGRSI